VKAIVYDDYRWNLVPLEPTEMQLEEARRYMVAATIEEARRIYRAMVATAPEAPRENFTGPRKRNPEF
jgi:hypothetical protein